MMKRLFANLQKLGAALMLPIAVLPVAGLLLRLGQPDLLNLAFVAAAGDAVFSNLGLLFAAGVAVGLARGNHGAAAVAAVVAYFVSTKGAFVLLEVPPDVVQGLVDSARDAAITGYKNAAIAKMSVPIGLICGILAGALYNRYSDIRLPDYLAFFAGRRFVPIVSGFAALLLAAAFGRGWTYLELGMDTLSAAVVDSGELGLFLYGVLNRVLIITGLHHILNNLAWFVIGDFEGVTGDLRRFFAGDPSAGLFMSGFYPVMMFGLPAACFAMYRSVPPERRRATGGLLLSMGLTSFLTGITEPIEFAFMFAAPLLYALHAILTGLSMVILDVLNVRLGFGFSAGLFDYVLNYGRATNPLLLIPVGAAYAVVYYAAFRFFIRRFNIPTPGRLQPVASPVASAGESSDSQRALIAALGGASNLLEVGACTTRLRLRVNDAQSIDDEALRKLGAAGVLRAGGGNVQVVVGLNADRMAQELRSALALGESAASVVAQRVEKAESDYSSADALIELLGGASNIIEYNAAGNRLIVRLAEVVRPPTGDELQSVGLRACIALADNTVHLQSAESAQPIRKSLELFLGKSR